MIKTLLLKTIRRDGGTQQRAALDEATIAEYQESIERGDKFPAMRCVDDGTTTWLEAGFHRAEAYERAGVEVVEVDVRDGTLRDAILFSLGDNADHGLRRSAEDKRHAVGTALADAEWGQWSDRAIAQACNVSHTFVSQMRARTAAPVASSGNVATESPKSCELATLHTPESGNVATLARPPLAKVGPAGQQDGPAASIGGNVATDAAPGDGADDEDPTEQEQADALASAEDEAVALRVILDADDKLAAAHATIVKQGAQIRVLTERVLGLTSECAAATRLAKSWRLKYERGAK